MKLRKVLALFVFILLLVAVSWSVIGSRPAHAQTSGGPIVIPKSYGSLKGSLGTALVFEDNGGTIRIVDTTDEGGYPAARIIASYVRR